MYSAYPHDNAQPCTWCGERKSAKRYTRDGRAVECVNDTACIRRAYK